MNIIIGANGYLGSFLHYKIEKSIGVVRNNPSSNLQISYADFIEKYNNNEYKMYNIIICCTTSSIKSVINDLKKNSNKLNKFILISSAVVYDGINRKNCVYRETSSKSFCSNDLYAKTTYNNEKLFNELNGSKIILRCGTMYGFSPNLNATRGINRMLYSSLFNNKIELNTFNLKKSFVSLNDIFYAIFYLSSNKATQEIVHESELEQNKASELEQNKIVELEEIILDSETCLDLESDTCLDSEPEPSSEITSESTKSEVEKAEIYNLSSFIMSLHNLGRMFKNRFDVAIDYKQFNKKEYEFYLNTDKIKKMGWKPQSTFRTIVEDITCDFDSLKKLSYNLNRIEQVENRFNYFSCFNSCFNNNTNDNNIENTIWKKKEECRVCQSKSLFNVLNLGNQPPPNRLSDKYYKLLSFPLVLVGCSECYHLQLNGVVNPSIMYKDYTYTSGTSQTMNLYFKNFVEKVNNNILIKINKNKKTVLDIACNDGCLLDYFKDKNYETYGIDPAENLTSKIKQHKVWCDFFDINSAKKMNMKFDVITAFNVFAHVDDIYEFINAIDIISHNETIVYIQTSQANMITNNEFDTIYHEHLSFFNIKSMNRFLSKTSFFLSDVEITDVHGGSYLFKLNKHMSNTSIDDTVNSRLLKEEIHHKLYNLETYNTYSNNINQWSIKLASMLRNSNKVIGVGASAKGITIMNFLNNRIKVDYVIDESKLKINKIINSVNVQIKDFSSIINELDGVTFVLFAWNFKDELIKKIKKLRPNNRDKIINLFPLEIC
jgi:2-polyprenyl-3-methyl-5-hydroxy-6-metoxy-1,4-benzoquinol methylase/nucleoside-diphosphate-sugar epimerase